MRYVFVGVQNSRRAYLKVRKGCFNLKGTNAYPRKQNIYFGRYLSPFTTDLPRLGKATTLLGLWRDITCRLQGVQQSRNSDYDSSEFPRVTQLPVINLNVGDIDIRTGESLKASRLIGHVIESLKSGLDNNRFWNESFTALNVSGNGVITAHDKYSCLIEVR